MGKPKEHAILLAVSPGTRGLGFAVFENAATPIDWGVKHARLNRLRVYERHVESLIEFYKPKTLILEHIGNEPYRKRTADCNSILFALGTLKGLEIVQYRRDDVKDVFSQFGPSTKFGITRTIGTWLPELRAQLPRYRRPWMSDDYSMAIFDAIALALTHYYRCD